VIEIPFPERGAPRLIESGARRREPAAEVEAGYPSGATRSAIE
jgi:hypothetical protein